MEACANSRRNSGRIEGGTGLQASFPTATARIASRSAEDGAWKVVVLMGVFVFGCGVWCVSWHVSAGFCVVRWVVWGGLMGCGGCKMVVEGVKRDACLVGSGNNGLIKACMVGNGVRGWVCFVDGSEY